MKYLMQPKDHPHGGTGPVNSCSLAGLTNLFPRIHASISTKCYDVLSVVAASCGVPVSPGGCCWQFVLQRKQWLCYDTSLANG